MALKISVQLVLIPSAAKAGHSLEAVFAHGDLDDDVRSELGEVASLAEHAVDVIGDDFRTHRPGRDLADLLEDVVIAAAHLGKERGVGCDAVQDAPAGGGADLIDPGGVQKDLHGGSSRLGE